MYVVYYINKGQHTMRAICSQSSILRVEV